MKSKTVILAILFICILASVAGGFWYWTRTPQYSMIKLVEAVHNHDGPSFRHYFDPQSVSSNFVIELTNEGLNNIGGPQLLRRFVGVTIAEIFQPEITEALAKSINNFVEKNPDQIATEPSTQAQQQAQLPTPPQADTDRGGGILRRVVSRIVNKVVEAIKPPPLRDVLSDMGLTKNNFRGLTNFQVDGQLCHVGLIFQAPNQTSQIIVMLELEHENDHWQVTRISNLSELARILTASNPP